MTCYDDLFVTERYARESLTDCALCVSGNGRLVSGILMIWKGRVQIAFLMFLIKAGQTGFLTGLKNTACTCVAYIPGSISSCCLFSISTWAVFLAGYIEKQVHGGLLKLFNFRARGNVKKH